MDDLAEWDRIIEKSRDQVIPKKFLWEIGVENLRAAYEKHHSANQVSEEQFLDTYRQAINRSVDWDLVDMIESYDELEYDLLRSLP